MRRDLERDRKRELKQVFKTVGRRRLKAVRASVGRDGSLAIADWFPGAAAQDKSGRGGVITGSPLAIWFSGVPRKSDFAKTVNGKRYLFRKLKQKDRYQGWVKRYAREVGKPVYEVIPRKVRSRSKGTTRWSSPSAAIPVATLKRSVRTSPTTHFFKTAQRREDEYRERLQNELVDRL